MCTAFWILPKTASAAVPLVSGDLIKLEDDSNPATTADSAVYYYGNDGKRYVFPNEKTYFTWYSDFSGVKEISITQMAGIPIAANVTYRPGVKLVKIQTDPKVYAVSKGGILRPIDSESVAVDLYGFSWNQRIDDIPDAFFVDYTIGASISSAAGYNSGAELSGDPNINVDKGLLAGSEAPSAERSEFEVVSVSAPQANYIRGAQSADVAAFIFKAASSDINVVRSIKFQGYIDEQEGDPDFSQGIDNDNGTTVSVHQMVPALGLYDSSGSLIAGPVELNSFGEAVFTDMSLSIPAGTDATFTLRGDISPTIDVESAPDRLAFDIKNVDTDVVVTSPDETAIPSVGAYPNGGDLPAHYISISQQGTAAFEWVGESGFARTGAETLLGTLWVDVKKDSFQLEELSFVFISQLESIKDLRLAHVQPGGVEESVTRSYGGNVTTFTGLPFVLSQDERAELRLYATLHEKDTDFYNERIQIIFNSTNPLKLVSATTDEIFDRLDLETPEFPLTSHLADLFVRFTEITFALQSSTPNGTIGRNQEQEILRFTITADSEGGARISRLTFKLTPGDVATSGPDNDALEGWADINGDYPDDNNLVNLWRTDVSGGDPLGEDNTATIKYSVVRDNVRDETPSDLESRVNDYGLVEYQFNFGQEIHISAGETASFRLEIDTTEFALNPQDLEVEVLGETYVEWTDLEDGNYTPISGVIVPGLPLESPKMIVE